MKRILVSLLDNVCIRLRRILFISKPQKRMINFACAKGWDVVSYEAFERKRRLKNYGR